MLGRADDAEAALRQLREVFARLPSEVTGDRESWFAWPEYRLRRTESFVYSELGQFAQATEAQDPGAGVLPGGVRSWPGADCRLSSGSEAARLRTTIPY
jgi:hypothetical protein